MPTRRVLPTIAPALIPVAVLVVLLAPQRTDLPIAWLSTSHLLGNAAAGGTGLWWALEDACNVVLFLPLGYLLAGWVGPLPGVLLGGAVSAGCEFAQQYIPHRHASALDVLMNLLGTCLGIAAALIATSRRTSDDQRLAAVRARPIRRIARARDLHAMQARGAVRVVEPLLVEGTTGGGQREVVAVGTVVAHAPIVHQGADLATLGARSSR